MQKGYIRRELFSAQGILSFGFEDGFMDQGIDERRLKRLSWRELIKLALVALVGAFALPGLAPKLVDPRMLSPSVGAETAWRWSLTAIPSTIRAANTSTARRR